jgi:hypothetical protein
MAAFRHRLLSLLILAVLLAGQAAARGHAVSVPTSQATADQQTVVLVDDFAPQPIQGTTFWPHNRLGGDRGQIDDSNIGGGGVTWGTGVVTATIPTGTETFKGVWTALNHPITEHVSLNFSAIFPPQILPQYQGRVTDLHIRVRDGSGTFQVELRAYDPALSQERTVWLRQAPLPTTQPLSYTLPLTLTQIQNLNWVVLGDAGDFAAVERVDLAVKLPQLDTARRAFLWSYAMLLNNWDRESGLTRDHAYLFAGYYDNVSASGMQAAAAVLAWQLGFISRESAVDIVSRTTQALLALPRTCHGLWPHFVRDSRIIPKTEWSSIDTVIAAMALLEAREALNLETAEVQAVLTGIDWNDLKLHGGGYVGHGYVTDCSGPIQQDEQGPPARWKDFGTESWLVNFGYAAATGNVAEFDHTPPTYNGSGFIDELAWLLVPLVPAPCRDRWGTDWCAYRQQAADRQINHYQDHRCFGKTPRLFGLSAAEVPDLSTVVVTDTYRAFGVGGVISPTDGIDLFGHAVIVPHYAALIASLRPAEAVAFWEWIEAKGLFTPLNNVESFMLVDEPACKHLVWNALKGSWNLSLQTLGWGRLLAGDNHPLFAAVWSNHALRRGYTVMWKPAYRTFLPVILRRSS